MAFMNLIQEHNFSKSLKAKLQFYTQENIFKINKDNIVGSYRLSDIRNSNIKNICSILIEKLPLFTNQVNILYVREKEKWDIIGFFSEASPIIVVNLYAIEIHYKEYGKKFDSFKEAVAYSSIFGFLSVFFGQNYRFECFGEFSHLEKYSITFDIFEKYEQIAKFLFEFYKNHFMFYLVSEDKKINIFFNFGKKYVYSLAILFNKSKLSIFKASKLLNLPENEVSAFLNEYKGVAYISYLKHQTGEII